MRKTCLDMVYQLAKEDPRLLFIGSDLGAGTLSQFPQDMPERFFMEGISEANVIGMAAGLALNNKIVYVNTIASFLTRRCYEQLVLDLCLHKVRVRLIGNGGGLVYAPLGPTHQTMEDLAIMRCLPHMAIIAPADAEEMKRLMPQTVDYPGPLYIRLAKGYDPVVSSAKLPCVLGKGIAMARGQHGLLVTTGIMLGTAQAARELLAKEGLDMGILHLPTLKPLDVELLREMMAEVELIVSLEEHSIVGGLGSSVAEVLSEACFSTMKRFKRLGLPDAFAQGYGSQQGLLQRYGLDPQQVAGQVRQLADQRGDTHG